MNIACESVNTIDSAQVSELAEKAADRATRVAACEFLHAITLWMIGKPSFNFPLLSTAQALHDHHNSAGYCAICSWIHCYAHCRTG